MFEVLGRWVSTVAEPEVRLLLDRHSHHCAWRAEQWWDRLPVLADVDRGALCAAPSPAAAAAADRLGRLDGPVARLAAAYRVALPRLWVAYDRHRAEAGDVADGSALRTLRIVRADLEADWREGEAVLEGLITGREAADQAAATVAELEGLLASRG